MLNPSQYWYRRSLHLMTLLFLPFAFVFGLLAAVRRWLYRVGFLKIHRFATPVIVVGNITVGGTGKTPFVIWLADFLRSQGYFPGIVSRGYGGKKQSKPVWVDSSSMAEEIGDEAVLLARRTCCPMVVCADRVAATRELLRRSNSNVVISDDGLQHYRLGRAVEIAIVDGKRRFGNQLLLPAGPLREPPARLNQVDYVVVNEGHPHENEMTMQLLPSELVLLKDDSRVRPTEFINKKVHAVAGIGHPERFFNTLKNMGFDVIPHVFPDHYHYSLDDFRFKEEHPIIMTEKDAVKCKPFAGEHYWYLPVAASVSEILKQKLLFQLQTIINFSKRENNQSEA